MRRHVAIALGVYAGALALFIGFVAVPFVTKKRDIPAEVPSPPPLVSTSLDELRGGGRLCMTGVAISAETQQLRFKAGTYHQPGPALAVSVRSPGYRADGQVPAGYADNSTVAVDVPRPAGSRLVTVCIRNAGTRKIALYAAEDRARSRVAVFVDGKSVPGTPTLSFDERRPVSVGRRAGVIAGRIAVFRGFLDHAWIVWMLGFAALVVVPVLIGLGGAAAMRAQRGTVSSGE